MSGTGGLAGRGAGLGNVGTVGTEVNVVGGLLKHAALGGGVDVDMLGGVDLAELLAELESVVLAVLDALTAGDAVSLVDNGLVVGTHAVRLAKILGNAQREAGAAAAVADGGGVLKAGSLVDLVYETVILGTLEDLVGLFLGDKTVFTIL